MASRHHIGRLFALPAAAALFALAGPAQAQPFPLNGLWNYQGRLTDAGSPANGQYDIQIVIFDRPVGGGALSLSFHNNVQVTNGLFTIPDVSTGFLSIFQGDRRWAEIQVRPGASGGALTVLTPRQELTATPYAMWANRAAVAGNGANHTLNDAYNSGGAGAGRVIQADSGEVAVQGSSGMRVELALRVGDIDTNGVFELYTSGATRTFELRDHFGQGGSVQGYEEGGVRRTFWAEPDIDGEGGFFTVHRDGGANAFQVDGNAIGGDPVVTVTGDTRTVRFSPGAASDNASVALPVDSIGRAEILDEPGVSSAHRTGPSYAPGVITITEESSITVPVDGFLFVVASSEVVFSHVNGTATGFTQGINVNDSTSFPVDQDFRTNLPSALPSGSYQFIASCNGVFPVSAGSHTVYLLGQENSGNVSFTNDVQLSVAFFPTAYGAVDPRGGRALGDDSTPERDRYSITPQDVADSQAISEQLYAERISRELADVRAQLAELRKLLGASANNQPNR